MKGTEPAYPIFLREGLSHNSHVDCGISTRLLIASNKMDALLSNGLITAMLEGNNHMPVMSEIAHLALEATDELIKQEEATRCLGE